LGLTILQEAPLMISPIRGSRSSSSSSTTTTTTTTTKTTTTVTNEILQPPPPPQSQSQSHSLQPQPQPQPQQLQYLQLLDDKSGPLPSGKLSNFLNPQFWTDYWAYQQQPLWVQDKIKQHYYDPKEAALYQKAIDMVLLPRPPLPPQMDDDLQQQQQQQQSSSPPPIIRNTAEFVTVIMVFRYNAATVTGIGTYVTTETET
jgi:hypothetical protein